MQVLVPVGMGKAWEGMTIGGDLTLFRRIVKNNGMLHLKAWNDTNMMLCRAACVCTHVKTQSA